MTKEKELLVSKSHEINLLVFRKFYINFDSEVGTSNCSNPVDGTEGNCSPDCDSATAAASAKMLSDSAFVDSSTPVSYTHLTLPTICSV